MQISLLVLFVIFCLTVSRNLFRAVIATYCTYIIATQKQLLLVVDCTYFCNKVEGRTSCLFPSPFQPKHYCSALIFKTQVGTCSLTDSRTKCVKPNVWSLALPSIKGLYILKLSF